MDRLQERLIADYRKASLLAYQDVILEWVDERLKKMEAESEVLALRYHTVMASLESVEAREQHLNVLLKKRAVNLAGPLGLSLIAEYALEKERYDLVLLAEQQILNRMIIRFLAWKFGWRPWMPVWVCRTMKVLMPLV